MMNIMVREKNMNKLEKIIRSDRRRLKETIIIFTILINNYNYNNTCYSFNSHYYYCHID